MKQYELRNLDLSEVHSVWESESEVEGFIDAVTVMHEFESEAEADKRRLDWLETVKGWDTDTFDGYFRYSFDKDKTIKEQLDFECPPPRPTLTILAAPDGWEMDQVAPEIREKFEIKDGRESWVEK